MKLQLNAMLSGIVAVASLLNFSCATDLQEEKINQQNSNANTPIAISSRIVKIPASTRITGQYFDENEAIGLYVLNEPETLKGKRHIENMRFVYHSSNFSPDTPIYYPEGECECSFISYYPYKENAIAESTSQTTVTTNADQSTLVGFSTSDFMVAKVSHVTPNKNAVELQYNHKLCQLNIVIRLLGNDNINELQKSATISIENVCTQASYDFDTEQFSSLALPKNITLNGQWSVDEENRTLTGKKAIFIPQPTTNIQLSFQANNKTFLSSLPSALLAQSGISHEITLNYDSRIGLSDITPDISNWNPGESFESDLIEQESSYISIANLTFGKSNVYQLVTESNAVIGEICKEYLKSESIDTQAIVLYTSPEKNKGVVLQLIGETNKVHGGMADWNMSDNTFNYTVGNRERIEYLSLNTENQIVFEKAEQAQKLTLRERVLTDTRGAETITYPIVKIGTQYWMRADLSASKYNDGSSLPNNTSSLDKKSAGYYNKNNRFYYNKSAVATGKLAPSGWAIPSKNDWELLKKYIGNQSAVLKGGQAWVNNADIEKPTNKTGFNGEPVGYYYSKTTPCKYSNSGTDVAFWDMGETGNSLVDPVILLTNKDNGMRGITLSDYCAYSIRCINKE